MSFVGKSKKAQQQFETPEAMYLRGPLHVRRMRSARCGFTKVTRFKRMPKSTKTHLTWHWSSQPAQARRSLVS